MMIKKIVGDKYFCGLDIGAYSIKAALIEARDSERPSLVGVFEAKTSGYKDASVADLEELTECIQHTMRGLTKKTRVKLKEIVLGISGELVQTRSSHAAIPLVDRGNKVINHRDLRKIHSQTKLLGVNMDEMVLHHFPQYYKVDDVNIALNPLGLFGRKLEMYSLLIITRNTLVKNLMTAVNQAGFDVARLFFSSYASSYASLKGEHKQLGSILIDLGSSFSNILMFKDGRLLTLIPIPLGGYHVSKNIAQELNLTFDLAEEIKKSYGCIPSTDQQGEEDILIKRRDGYLPIKKKSISDAIDPVTTRLIDELLEAVKGSELFDQMSRGIVLVGGGALLPGLPERLEQETNLPVQVGQIHVAMRKLTFAPKFATAVGLAQSAILPADGELFAGQHQPKGIGRLLFRMKELYQEYF